MPVSQWRKTAQHPRSRRLGRTLAALSSTLLLAGVIAQLIGSVPSGAATGSGAATVTVTASPSTVSPGSPVTLTASVASANGGPTPTGSVVFFIGGLQVGATATCSNGLQGDCLDATGTATVSLSNVASGSYQVYASYSGDSTYARVSYVNSTPGTFTVSTNVVDNTTTTLQVTPNSNISANQQASLVATVVDANNVAVTSGEVTFFNLTTNATIASASVNSQGVASYTSSSWPVGTFDIEATYVGPITFGASSASAMLTVTNSVTITNTVTTLRIAPPDITAAQSSVLEATVTDTSGNPVTTGTVTFFNTTTNTPIQTIPVASDGTADLLTGNWPPGKFVIEATYQGPVTMAPSGDSANLQVFAVMATTTTTVTVVSPSPAPLGQPVEITASVSASELTGPTGTVTFYSDGSPIGTGTLNSSGVATLSIPGGLPLGTHQITASYGGDTLDSPSGPSAPVTLDVFQVVGTSTTPSVSPSPSVLGQSVNLSATVTAPSGTPTGSVSFNLGSASGTTLCSGALARGVATCSTASLPLGQNTIVASYSGDANDLASSASTSTTVNPAPSATVASATPATSQQGQQVTLSASVTSATGLPLTPTGSVTFSLGSASGPTICIATVSAGTATCTTTALPTGSDTIVANYGGDSTFAGSLGNTAATVSPAIVVDVTGTMSQGSSQATFSYTGPSGVDISGTLSCQTVGGGTDIGPSLAAGDYTIDGKSCTGLSAGGSAITYVGITGGFVVTPPAPGGTCSSLSLPPPGSAITGGRHGDIVVPSGQTLYIAGGTVTGDITLQPGAALLMTGGKVGGNLTIAAGDAVTVTGGTVEGGITTEDSPVSLCGGLVNGGVDTTGGTLLVQSASVHGGVDANGSSWVAISGAKISGTSVISGTTGTPPQSVSKATPTEDFVCSSSISGQLVLSSSTAAPFEVGSGPDCTSGVTATGGISQTGTKS